MTVFKTQIIWLLALGLSILVGYSNCSKVNFQSDQDNQAAKLNESSAMVINNDEVNSWTIDRTGPAINVRQQPLSTLGEGDTAAIRFSVTDSGSGVSTVFCGLNDQLTACYPTDTREYTGLRAGDYTFTIHATDNSGNESKKIISWTVGITQTQITQDISVKGSSKLDILVVIDNSGSMATEQENMAMRFSSFIDQLGGVDWQIALVTTDLSGTTARKDGRLLKLDGMPDQYILNSTMDPATAKQVFGNTVQREEKGSGSEQGIGATYRAIERSQSTAKTNAPNAAFFRTDAALAVLVVTDTDETSRQATSTRNTPEGLIDLVNTTWNNQKAFSYHSIIVKPGDTACVRKNGNEDYGYAYEAISKLTGGIIGSVCAYDYGSQLAAIGQSSAELIRSATLKCQPIDTTGDGKGDVEISTADGSAAPGYIIEGTKITFDRDLPAGTNRLIYTCLSASPVSGM